MFVPDENLLGYAVSADITSAVNPPMWNRHHIAPFSYLASPEFQPGEGIMSNIKGSLTKSERLPLNEQGELQVRNKVHRLRELGVIKQAEVLESELRVHQKLQALTEWDYKVLPYDVIKAYDHKVINTFYQVVHIEPLETYVGKDNQTMPDAVLDDLEKAKERQLFDSFAVLSVEKVKDPLLLGQIKGCKDFFFIAEWSDDVSFEQITGEKYA